MQMKRMLTVSTVSGATADDNTVTGSTVAVTTVLCPKDATVFESTKPETTLKDHHLHNCQNLQKLWNAIWQYCV